MQMYSYNREIKTVSKPSFSSSLLDSIYQSIDQGEDKDIVVYIDPMRKKQQISSNLKEKKNLGLKYEEKLEKFRRLRMIEKWIEKESGKVDGRRKSSADFVPNVKEVSFSNSRWSSSDSRSGCLFSSSEVQESVLGISSNMPSESSCYSVPKPTPIKINISIQQKRPNHEDGKNGGFDKIKPRALKIYGDLKKLKQTISPCGKLASFLNSLFNAGNANKAKNEGNSERKMIKSVNASTCSSTSSLSRSCLSKTTSSRVGKSGNGIKRSVRFNPVSEIVDGNGHTHVYDDKQTSLIDCNAIRSSLNEEIKNLAMEKNQRVEEAAKDLLRNFQKRVVLEHDLRSRKHAENQIFIDDDAASCASSDLFELDDLSGIGMERYKEELPVYETTHLDTNLSIAKGMIM